MRLSFSGLWRERNFLTLWTGQTISQFGSQIGAGALRYTAILALGVTPVQLSLLAAAQIVPALLLGLLVGVWVDRRRRRPLLIAADVGRGLLLLSVPLAALLGLLRVEQLYLVAALVGALSIVFDVAYHSFLLQLVRREQLVEGNSKLGVSDALAEIAGPPSGGALVQLVGGPLAVALDALSFFVSALSLGQIRVREEPPPAAARQRVLPEVAEGLRATLGHPLLLPLLGVALTRSLAGGIIGTLYDLYLLRELGLGPALIGLTVAVGGVSSLAGALLAGRVTARLGLGQTMAVAAVFGALEAQLLPLARGPWGLGMIMLAQSCDMIGTIFQINALSLRQAAAPAQLLGRVNASFQALSTGALLLGTLLAGPLAELLGLRMAMALGTLGIALSGLWVFASPLRRLQHMPEALEPEDPILNTRMV